MSLRNIAMRVWQTDGQTDRQTTDGRTDDGQSDPYVSLCFAGDTTIGREIYRNILLCEFYWFFTTAKWKEGCVGLNIQYLTSSPKPLHWFKKKKLDGKQVTKVFSLVCLFWADQSVFYQFHFFLFFKEKHVHVYSSIQCVPHNYLLTE